LDEDDLKDEGIMGSPKESAIVKNSESREETREKI
jgi:hypothetical protein